MALALILPSIVTAAYAQSFPIPPPLPGSSDQSERVAPNDKTPPKIEILTEKLHAGMNVFEVRITDDSSLKVREVKFVHDGQFKTEGLFRDRDDIYKGLVDIQAPSRIVVVTAGDAAGNMATAYKEYEIQGSPDILSAIQDMFSKLPQLVQDFLDLFT